jgi:UDP-glucose 4-epimerase
VTAVEGDLLDPASLAEALEGVSAIIHLAAVFRTQDTDLIWKSNLEGTRNLIAAAKAQASEARFIMASTSHVYNMDSPHPGREDDATDPQPAYPASKVAAEKELRESGLNWSIQRFGFVYGDQDGHLESVPKHAINAKWHPAQKMSMIHHRDIATAMKLALTGAMDGFPPAPASALPPEACPLGTRKDRKDWRRGSAKSLMVQDRNVSRAEPP